MRDRRLTITPVFDDELVIIAGPAHPFARRTHVKLADMRGETLFVYPPREQNRVLNKVLLPAGAEPRPHRGGAADGAITELVKAGLGVSVIARWAVQPLVASGALVARPLTSRGLHRRWSTAVPKDRAKADYIGEFVDLLARYAPAEPAQARRA